LVHDLFRSLDRQRARSIGIQTVFCKGNQRVTLPRLGLEEVCFEGFGD
jgi:hypothetical protein